MYSASASVLAPQRRAASLPNPWPSFVARQIEFRRGELTFVAGSPGSGKSSLALALAVQSGVPTLYLAADTTRTTTNIRLLAMLANIDQHQAEQHMYSNPEWASQVLAQASHITFDDDSSPTLSKIELLFEAYAEMWGGWPELIILDNAGDVVGEGSDEFGWLRALPRIARTWGQKMNAAMVVLHHTREERHPFECPPLSALQGKIGPAPSLVLTVNGLHTPGLLAVAPVKHRHGTPSSDGGNPVFLRFDPARMQVTDLQGGEWQ